MAVASTALLLVLLLTSSALGWRLRRSLPQQHRTQDTVDAVRLIVAMLVTFSALVLGLLTSSVKARFDADADAIRGFGVRLTELDQRLREYGPEADSSRALLRTYTAAVLVDTWPGIKRPPGRYPVALHPAQRGSAESLQLGDMLARIDLRLLSFAPVDPLHANLAALLRMRMASLMHERWTLIETAHATLSWPFLAVLMLWLMIVFAIFGLSSPPNAVVIATVLLCTLSVSSALFLILDFDGPFTGLLKVSSQPIRDALRHMDEPARVSAADQ